MATSILRSSRCALKSTYLAYRCLPATGAKAWAITPSSHRLRNMFRLFSSITPGDDVIIGIAFGTTNSYVSVMNGKSPKMVENSEGVRSTPSLVSFNQKGEVLVGSGAKLQADVNPTNTIFGIKHVIGRCFRDNYIKKFKKKVPYKILNRGGAKARLPLAEATPKTSKAHIFASGKTYSPLEICAFVFTKLKENAEAFLENSVSKAVVAVPVDFTDAQRRAVKDAALIAGLDVHRLISEPAAAALSYGLNNKDGLIAVYRLGGGTFNVSILESFNGVLEVKATSGDVFFGGENFDEALLKYLVREFKKTDSIDLSKNALALRRLREAAEKAKIELSSASQTDINLPCITANASGAKHLNISMTREKLESLVEHLIERTRDFCWECLSDAGISMKDIETVFEIFGKSPSKGANPEEAVAMGAAVQGAIQGAIYSTEKSLSEYKDNIPADIAMYLHKYSLFPPVDWRKRGAVTSVIDQGDYDTCWAVNTVAVIESFHFIQTGRLVKLSAQEVLDRAVANGCKGASEIDAYEYVAYYGVCSESAYPYTGLPQKCASTKRKSSFERKTKKKMSYCLH
ncbi:hypothetical protein MKW92_050508 [Papaver armeniacum]|nr:hypothetical protein MKW92_050508 [Papaver armeniacum]